MSVKAPFILACILTGFCLCKSAAKKEEIPVVAASDIALIATAYQQTLYSDKIAEEALTRSTYKETKQFASDLIASNERLRSAFNVTLGKKNATLPLDITNQQLQKWQQLVQKKGWLFDVAFLEEAVSARKNEVAALKKVSTEAEDADIKNTALDILQNRNDLDAFKAKQKEIVDTRQQRDSSSTTPAP